ncbi:Rha family transcriptional regulator [Paenibacillus sp. QZ-Y1]|uniref:Rha family transcriptional regulator n=1 Tax=Paenibacillus sp. QZ-Y1 TaxID=3414511 RepID=UPI003F7A89FF
MTNKLQLVFEQDGRFYTDSILLAEKFNKRHDDVLRAIRNVRCSNEFTLRNFAETPYMHSQNKQTYIKYNMTKDGYIFIAMGFTGKKADQLKEDYINAFNELEQKYLATLEEIKSLYAQLFTASNSLPFNAAVKSFGIGIGRNKVMADLRKRKILLKGSNLPAQRFLDNGYFEVKDVIKKNKYRSKVIPTTYVTPKGIDYLAKIYAL